MKRIKCKWFSMEGYTYQQTIGVINRIGTVLVVLAIIVVFPSLLNAIAVLLDALIPYIIW